MFFKLNFLIILTRLKKSSLLFYLIDNQYTISGMSDLNLYTRLMQYVRIAIILMFFVLGVFVLFSPNFNYIPWNFRVIFSIFILLYGIYRLISSFQKFKKDKEEEL
jgi:ABC-type nickel/cobalt efflux system permease component RcnA